jgi:hypothetical protein
MPAGQPPERFLGAIDVSSTTDRARLTCRVRRVSGMVQTPQCLGRSLHRESGFVLPVIPLIPVNRATRRLAAGDPRNSNHFGLNESLHFASIAKADAAQLPL